LTVWTAGIVPPILPLVAREWSLSPLESGLVNSIFALGRLIGSYPASLLRARHETRAAAFSGVAAATAGTLMCGAAPSFWVFLAGRLLMGIGLAATLIVTFAEVLDRAPLSWRGRSATAFDGTTILSEGVGALAGGLAGRFGWRKVFLSAGPVLLLSLVGWRALGRTPGHVAIGSDGDRPRRPGGVTSSIPVIAAGAGMAVTSAGVLHTLVPLLGYGVYGLSTAELSLTVGASYGAELVGLVAVSVAIDRVRRELVFMAGALTAMTGALVLAGGHHQAVFIAGVMLAWSGFAVWTVPAAVLVDRAGIPVPPHSLALYRTVMDAGLIVGPLGLGALADLTGERIAVSVGGTAFVAGAVALYRTAAPPAQNRRWRTF
jgi:MFS family permease